MNHEAPRNPAGDFQPVESYNGEIRLQLIQKIKQAPNRLRGAVAGLTETQLDTLYRNWTIRQITHHVADSHLHVIIRFKWALTENYPTIKPYAEGDWAALEDSRHGDIEPALKLLEGVHQKWVQLLNVMTEQQYARCFHHPETNQAVSLWQALNNYAWHGEHHTAQILWLRDHYGWNG